MAPRGILFDLDGTLVQTREASWLLFARTSQAFGLGIDGRDAYFALLEDNLFASLRRACRDERTADAAIAHFMDLLRAEYSPSFIPGMLDVVKALAGTCSLAIISSNAIEVIRRILENAGIAHCFAHVFAGDVQPDKRVAMRQFLADQSYSTARQCTPAYDETEAACACACEVTLVTDTAGDIRHAKECGIRAVGVAWGMHGEAQLREAGADQVALWPQELIAWLSPGGAGRRACACAAVPVPAAPLPLAAVREAAAIRRQRRITAAAGHVRPGADAELLAALSRIMPRDARRATAVARETNAAT